MNKGLIQFVFGERERERESNGIQEKGNTRITKRRK